MKIAKFVDIGEIKWEHFKQLTAGNTVVQINRADTKLGMLFSLRVGRLFYNFSEKKETFNHFLRVTDIDEAINLLKAAKEFVKATEHEDIPNSVVSEKIEKKKKE